MRNGLSASSCRSGMNCIGSRRFMIRLNDKARIYLYSVLYKIAIMRSTVIGHAKNSLML